MRHGLGLLLPADNSQYLGVFKNNIKCDVGFYNGNTNKGSYVGEFETDNRSGLGCVDK
jgi:hypothetical protein